MQVNQEALNGAIKALRLKDIYFRDERIVLNAEITPPFYPEGGEVLFKMTTRILHEFEAQISERDKVEDAPVERYVELEFGGYVRCLAGKEEDDEEVLNIETKLGLLYVVRGECPDECLDEFVRVNAAYHAIPYWREHVHSICSKRRFFPITVPLYGQMVTEDPVAINQAED